MTLVFSVPTMGKNTGVVLPTVANQAVKNEAILSSTFMVDKKSVKKILKTYTKKNKLSKIEKYKNKIFNLGIVDSDNDDEFIKIKKKPKKSQTIGYVADGGVVEIIENINGYYKVKSGSITGYIKEKSIETENIERTLLDNQDIEAEFNEKNVNIKSDNSKESYYVGIAYKGSSYPIIKFSDDYKKVKIQRTDTIEGWVSIKNIKIKINQSVALTESEYQDYLKEQERIRQEELNKILNAGISKTGNELFDTINGMIAHNESGNYVAARNGLPQFPGEKTITVGAWQWYGERAHKLLKRICVADTQNAKKLIENSFSGKKKKKEEKAKAFYDEIVSDKSFESRKRKFSKEELVAVKALLGSSKGIEIQNTQAKEDISARINVAKSTYKLTNPQLIAYFCDMFWQNPENARNITKACIAHFKSAKEFNKAEDALEYMHKMAKKNGTLGKFSGRRNYTYSVCSKLKTK
jgi:hypothetical protein